MAQLPAPLPPPKQATLPPPESSGISLPPPQSASSALPPPSNAPLDPDSIIGAAGGTGGPEFTFASQVPTTGDPRFRRGPTQEDVANDYLLKQLEAKGKAAFEKYPMQGATTMFMSRLLDVPLENIAELTVMGSDPNVSKTDYLMRVGRTALSALPGVAPPEVDPKYQMAGQAAELGNQATRGFGGAVAQSLGSTANFMANFGAAKGVTDAAAKALLPKVTNQGLRVLLGAEAAPGAGALESVLRGTIPSATAMGAVSATPALEQGDLRQGAQDFASGALTDILLRGFGATGSGVVDQIPKLSEGARRVLRPVAAGAAQGAGLSLQSGADAQQAGADILINALMPFAGRPVRKLMPGVENVTEFQKVETRPLTEPTPEQVTEASGPLRSKIPLQGDISFFEFANRKSRDAYLMPKAAEEGGPTALTAAEIAQRENPLPEGVAAKLGIEQHETPEGTVYFHRKELAQRLTSDPYAVENKLAVWDQQPAKRNEQTGFMEMEPLKLNVEKSIEKIMASGKGGWLLQYGEGNESKPDLSNPNAKTVTLYDRLGNEVTTITASNPESAAKALREKFGGAEGKGGRIETRPLEEGIREVIGKRPAFKPQPKAEPAPPPESEPFGPAPAPPNYGARPKYRPVNKIEDWMFKRWPLKSEAAMRWRSQRQVPSPVDPAFSGIVESSPDIADAMMRSVAATGGAKVMGNVQARLLEDLAKNPERVHLFMQDIFEAQGEAGAVQGRPVPDFFFNDPATKARIAQDAKNLAPLYESWKAVNERLRPGYESGGVQSERPIREGAEYASLTVPDLEAVENPATGRLQLGSKRLNQILAEEKRTGRKWLRGDPEVLAALRSGDLKKGTPAYNKLFSSGLIGREMSAQQADAAKLASFTSPVYSTHPQDVLERMYKDSARAGSRNDLIKALRAESAKIRPEQIKNDKGETVEKFPEWTDYGGKRVRTQAIRLGDLPSWMVPEDPAERKLFMENVADGKDIVVPEPVAQAFREFGKMDPYKAPNVAQMIAREFIGVDTAITTEDSTRRLWHSLSTLGSFLSEEGKSRLARIGGPPRLMAAVNRVLDVNDAQYDADFHALSQRGATDVRSMGQLDDAPSRAGEAVAKVIPGAPYLQEMIFGYKGVVNRVKVAVYRILKDMGYSDAEAINEVIRTTGTSVQQLKPAIVQFLSNTTVDQYAGAHAQALASGNRALGMSPRGFQPRVLASTLTGALLTTAIANALITDEDEKRGTTGRRVAGIPRHFRIGYVVKDGKQIPLLRNYDANVERSFRQFGISALLSNAVAGNLDEDTLGNMLTEAWTTSVSRAGSPFAKPLVEKFGRRFSAYGGEYPETSWSEALAGVLPGSRAYFDEKRDAFEAGREISIPGIVKRNLVGGGPQKAMTDVEVFKKLDKISSQEDYETIGRRAAQIFRLPVERWADLVTQSSDDPMIQRQIDFALRRMMKADSRREAEFRASTQDR